MTDTPDYGEPYTAENWRDGAALVNRDGDEVLILESLQRAASCVNACRGIENPEEVVPLLVKMANAAHVLRENLEKCRGELSDDAIEWMPKLQQSTTAAIAALQPKREGE